MKRLALLIPLLIACICPLFMAAKPDQPTKIVLIAGGRSHGPGEHEFRAGSMVLAKALNEQSGLNVKATVVGPDWKNNKAVLEGADAVVIYADGTSGIAGQWKHLDQLAKQGVGLMFMHYAVHPNAEQGENYYRPWIGGAFETGWSVNPHWVADMNALRSHSIANGIPDAVKAYDEFYYNMRFPKDRSKVLDLVTAVPTRDRMIRYINLWNQHGVDGLGKPQTLMWGIERPDGGRGVGFTGGHYHRNWSIDEFRTLVLNAVVWTAGMEVPKGGVKSASLTETTLNANLDEKGRKANLKLPEPGEWDKLKPATINTRREAQWSKDKAKK